MLNLKNSYNKKFVLIGVSFFAALCVAYLMFICNSAFAAENNDFDTITLKGKVVDASGDGVQSAQIQYNDGKDGHDIYYAALDGGFMFAMPASSDCTLIFYQDGYKPKFIDYTMEFLQEHKPVLDIGNIVLGSEEYVQITGNVMDSFYLTPISDVNVRFFMSNDNTACRALTDDNGDYSLTVPKGYEGFWKVYKDDYEIYESAMTLYLEDTDDVNFSIRPLNKFIISFISNGGSPIEQQIVDAGQCVVKPNDPNLENFVFDGWYLDDDSFKIAYNFSQPVYSHFTLYAKWSVAHDLINENSSATSDGLYTLEILLTMVVLCSLALIFVTKKNRNHSN